MTNKLKKIINDLIEALFCYDTFTYPISSEYPDIHIVSKVNIIENEIKEFKKEIKELYELDTFIPIIPQKGSEVYKCMYNKIYGNITKLSELIYYIKSLKINLDVKVLETILEKDVDPEMEISKDDIEKFNKKINLFDFLVIKKQREDYINELNNREKQINLLYKKIDTKRNYLNEIKNKPSYDLLSSKDAVDKILREQFQKKITIFIVSFQKDLNEIKLNTEIYKLIRNNFNWDNFDDLEIEKILDFICIILKDKLIKLYDNKLDVLVKKLNKTKNMILKLII